MTAVVQHIRIQCDDRLQPIGLVVGWERDDGSTTWQPQDVGPFDTVEEVLAHARSLLTEQLSLW